MSDQARPSSPSPAGPVTGPGAHPGPPSYPGQPGYGGLPSSYPGQPGYGWPYPPPLPEHPQGTTVLVLGILSLVVGVTAPFAWYYGSKAEKEIRADSVAYSNTSQIQIGRILGIVGTILLGLSVLFLVGYFVLFLAVFLPLVSQAR